MSDATNVRLMFDIQVDDATEVVELQLLQAAVEKFLLRNGRVRVHNCTPGSIKVDHTYFPLDCGDSE